MAIYKALFLILSYLLLTQLFKENKNYLVANILLSLPNYIIYSNISKDNYYVLLLLIISFWPKRVAASVPKFLFIR